MIIKVCRMCHSDNLIPKYISETKQKWVACDNCGNHSKPLITTSCNKLIDVWNKEQEIDGNV